MNRQTLQGRYTGDTGRYTGIYMGDLGDSRTCAASAGRKFLHPTLHDAHSVCRSLQCSPVHAVCRRVPATWHQRRSGGERSRAVWRGERTAAIAPRVEGERATARGATFAWAAARTAAHTAAPRTTHTPPGCSELNAAASASAGCGPRPTTHALPAISVPYRGSGLGSGLG